VLTAHLYFDHDENDTLDVFGFLDAGWESGGGLYVGVTDRLQRSESPIVIRDDTFTVIDSDLDPYWTNELTLRAGFVGCRWRIEGAWDSDLFWAEEGVSEAYNHWDNGWRVRGDYYLSEQTSVGAYAGFRTIHYDDSSQNDFTTWDLGVAATWRPNAKWSFGATAGVSTINSDGETDDTSGVGSLTVGYEATDCTSFQFLYQRSYEPSLGADDQIVDLLALRSLWIPSFYWQVVAGVGVQLGDTDNVDPDGTQDYTLWFFDVNVHHQFNANWGADASYQMRTQEADRNGIDFVDHRISIGVTFTF
jgi:hypothetical protein